MRKNLVSLRRFLRINIRLLASYIRANWRLFFLSFVVGLVIIYAFPQVASLFSSKRTQATALVGNYTISTLPLSVQREISFGLTTLTPDNKATTGAALSWSTSSGDKSITFNLDKNLFWQDGTKFDASQINYNLKNVEVKRLSLYSLQFNFAKPFSPLLTIVTQPLFKTGLVGLGKYKVSSIKFNGRFISSLELENTETAVHKIYKFYPTEEDAVNALKLGTVNKVIDLHNSYGLESLKGYSVHSEVSPDTEAVLFINLRKDKFADKTIRQSLAYALPDDFTNGETALTSLPKKSWVEETSAKKYAQNIDLAKADVAKISSDSGKIKITLSTTKELQSTAIVIAKAWENVGIATSVSLTDSLPSNYDVYLTYLNLPIDPDQYALWHSTQIGNISGYKSFKSDRLLEDGRKTFDLEQRKQIYSDFEKALTEDIPAIFLFYPRIYEISR